MSSVPSYHSFLLRLWRNAGSAGSPWSGELEEIQSGEVFPVSSREEAFRLIRRHTDEVDLLHPDPHRAGENPEQL